MRVDARARRVGADGARRGRRGLPAQSKTPEEAYQRFAAAVKAGDGAALFDALDQPTRWAWMTIQKYHREAYDIVLSNYPRGPSASGRSAGSSAPRRPRARASCSAPRPRPGLLPMLGRSAQGTAHRSGPPDGQAAAVLDGGGRVPFARGEDGGWGFAGLAKEAEDEKNRAYHDLEVVRASAADYERAAARAAK